MSKKSWHLDRRTFLRGTGVACALPYLEAMSATTSKSEAPKRMCFLYFPNGACEPGSIKEETKKYRFFPDQEGRDYKNNHSLEPLNDFRDDMTILGGLSHPRSRQLLGHIAGDTWLTGGDVRNTYKNNISIDQVAAGHFGKDSRYPSFALSADGGVGYKSRVTSLSFNSIGNAIPTEHRHREIFERYFNPTGGGSTEARRKELQRGRKIVDLVYGNSKDLQRKLGKSDKDKMDQYLTSLNSVEKQIIKNEEWLDIPLKKADFSKLNFDLDPTKNAETYIRSMYDLIVLAYEMDLTRVVTYQIAREDGMGFGENYPKLALNAKKGIHGISHSNDAILWSSWDNWLSQQYAYFLGRMKEVKDEHGSILDNTQVLYGSSQAHTHNARNLPLILAGGKNMGIKHGSYQRFEEKTPMTNLFVSMLNAAGVQRTKFSDSTGKLPGEIFS
jgi:hypothetical protein